MGGVTDQKSCVLIYLGFHEYYPFENIRTVHEQVHTHTHTLHTYTLMNTHERGGEILSRSDETVRERVRFKRRYVKWCKTC